jgi:hypothetical protein
VGCEQPDKGFIVEPTVFTQVGIAMKLDEQFCGTFCQFSPRKLRPCPSTYGPCFSLCPEAIGTPPTTGVDGQA